MQGRKQAADEAIDFHQRPLRQVIVEMLPYREPVSGCLRRCAFREYYLDDGQRLCDRANSVPSELKEVEPACFSRQALHGRRQGEMQNPGTCPALDKWPLGRLRRKAPAPAA